MIERDADRHKGKRQNNRQIEKNTNRHNNEKKMREKFIQIEIVNEVFLQWPSFFM